MAVPIISYGDGEAGFDRIPKGVVIAINKNMDGNIFTNDDSDNISSYNCLIIKVFEILTYFSNSIH